MPLNVYKGGLHTPPKVYHPQIFTFDMYVLRRQVSLTGMTLTLYSSISPKLWHNTHAMAELKADTKVFSNGQPVHEQNYFPRCNEITSLYSKEQSHTKFTHTHTHTHTHIHTHFTHTHTHTHTHTVCMWPKYTWSLRKNGAHELSHWFRFTLTVRWNYSGILLEISMITSVGDCTVALGVFHSSGCALFQSCPEHCNSKSYSLCPCFKKRFSFQTEVSKHRVQKHV